MPNQNTENLESEYFKKRVEEQIGWYDEKSIHHQKVYKGIKRSQIILTALIPFSAALVPTFEWILYIISGIGVLVTVLEGFLALGKHHENWIEFRGICETLKREKYMYQGKAGVYSENSEFNFLVERIETIISKENINWANLNHGDNKGGK
ncbi:DUF4231 domain-containing protein [Solibacillus sp. FSL R7-0682]|uniref:DUF4231 domain-containing protein n=1 Tax=Solibacillus sp. FSL R7-0682 TaxID=2921690 RepID=UPI0030F62AF4